MMWILGELAGRGAERMNVTDPPSGQKLRGEKFPLRFNVSLHFSHTLLLPFLLAVKASMSHLICRPHLLLFLTMCCRFHLPPGPDPPPSPPSPPHQSHMEAAEERCWQTSGNVLPWPRRSQSGPIETDVTGRHISPPDPAYCKEPPHPQAPTPPPSGPVYLPQLLAHEAPH